MCGVDAHDEFECCRRAQVIIDPHKITDLESLYLIKNDQQHVRSIQSISC